MVVVFYGIFDFLNASYLSASVFAISGFVGVPAILWGMNNGYEHAAKFGLLVMLNLAGLIAIASTPYDDQSYFFLIPVGLIAPLFFETREWKSMAAGIALPAIVFILSGSLNLPKYSPDTLEGLNLQDIRMMSFVGVYVTTFSIFLVYVRYLSEVRAEAATRTRFSALGVMSSSLAHEINNPLAVIRGKIHLVEKKMITENASPQDMDLLKAIQSNVARIGRIIDGLRLFSRDTSGDEKQTFSALNCCNKAIEVCREKLAAAGVRFDVQLDQDFRLVGSPTEMAQAIVNILINGRDAAVATKTPWVKIETNDCAIIVSDSGEGIPRQIAEQLMQPFFTTKGIGQGTGLGLSIAKGIINRHGGVLFLDESSPNTRFVIQFSVSEPNSTPNSST